MTAIAPANAAAVLHRAGWDLRVAEVNLVAMSARIQIVRRSDGLLVTFDARSDRCVIMRESAERWTAMVGRRGDRMPVERIGWRLIGMDRFVGVRAGMRFLANYIDDNGSDKSISAGRGSMRMLIESSTS